MGDDGDDEYGDDGDDGGDGDGNMTKVLWNMMSSSVRTKQTIFHYLSRQKRCGQSWLDPTPNLQVKVLQQAIDYILGMQEAIANHDGTPQVGLGSESVE